MFASVNHTHTCCTSTVSQKFEVSDMDERKERKKRERERKREKEGRKEGKEVFICKIKNYLTIWQTRVSKRHNA
jgi:hypothetical protein